MTSELKEGRTANAISGRLSADISRFHPIPSEKVSVGFRWREVKSFFISNKGRGGGGGGREEEEEGEVNRRTGMVGGGGGCNGIIKDADAADYPRRHLCPTISIFPKTFLLLLLLLLLLRLLPWHLCHVAMFHLTHNVSAIQSNPSNGIGSLEKAKREWMKLGNVARVFSCRPTAPPARPPPPGASTQ